MKNTEGVLFFFFFFKWKQNCKVQQLQWDEERFFLSCLCFFLPSLAAGSEEAEGVLANKIISGVATPTSITLQFKQNPNM